MSQAIFGITNDGLNLAATLFLLMLIVLWLALIVYTYLDARRRISDPFLVACATVASFFPYIGAAVYAIVRPPEFLEDAHERELEIKAAELRVRHLRESSCPNCEYPIEKNFLRCPNCRRRLKDPCPTCAKPVDPRWGLCPYCEASLGGGGGGGGGDEPPRRRRKDPEERPAPKRQQAAPRRKKAAAGNAGSGTERKEPATRESAREGSKSNKEKRSPTREPDPDPRQA